MGYLLEPFHESLRKRQRKNPKFFFFDTGVTRALERSLTQRLLPQTYAYGRAFEHFIVIEAHRLNAYYKNDALFSYVTTKDGAEIDLVIERRGMPLVFVEIKSSASVDERDTHIVESFLKDVNNAEGFCFSQDPRRKKIGRVNALPWQEGFKEIGLCE